MKKTALALLVLVYLAFTAGVVISQHYCMGRMDSIRLGTSTSEFCGQCGMHRSDAVGCCHDEITIYKILDDQLSSPTYKIPTLFLSALPSFAVRAEAEEMQEEPEHWYRPHGPPLPKNDTYLHNRVFRI